jgi:hypothetical protein
MFKQNTVFVVGAGASTEYGAFGETTIFPIGTQLRSAIKAGSNFTGRLHHGVLNDGDRVVFEWLRRRHPINSPGFSERIDALRQISQRIEGFDSIDECIEYLENPYAAEMGKVMIARYLAKAERECLLKSKQQDNRLKISALRDTWLERFVRILMNGRKDPNEIGKEITVICFNYDRCIEFYLINAIVERYAVPYEDAHRIVSTMAIIHPYGTLGRLPTSNSFVNQGEIEFGPDCEDRTDPWAMIGTLKTYTERIEDNITMSNIRMALFNSNCVVFLGFGFTSENMKLLDTSKVGENGSGCSAMKIATGKGQHLQSDAALKLKIANLFAGSWNWRDTAMHIEYSSKCSETLQVHYHNLSA